MTPSDKDNITGQLLRFLQQEFPNQGVELDESTDLLGEWFIDSLGIIETVLFLEKTFGIDIARADINGSNFRDIAALSGFVATRLKQTPPG